MTVEDSPQVVSSEDHRARITMRAKRAHGQLGAVVRMLEEGRSCEEVVTQMAAVSKAVHTAAFMLISASLRECLAGDDVDADESAAKLQKLFVSLA